MNRFAILALVLAGLSWGLGFPLGKLVLRETDAAHMVLLRFAVAAVAAAPFALWTAEARALFRSPVVLLAGGLYGLAFMVQFEGLAHVSVTLAALLVGAMPALIAVSARFFGERVSRASWAGVVAATLGASLIAGKPDGAGSPLGVALSVASLFVFLAWLIVMRRAPKVQAPLAIPAVTMIVATAAILPVAWLMHGPPKLDLSPVAWSCIIGQGVVATLLATAAWQYGSARVGAATAGVFINIEPLMGAVIGVMLFGDHLTLALFAGGLLILLGSFVVVLGEGKADKVEAV
ncbi:DMT family transporter [Caulobacter henricii]|uniref:Transporter n=1 Tax=Caulobacter henricii TaxID=69395 RepID=A0A0P0P3K3_9CAUL|nr:DMT family transporter [Caulobacter henricii]ALL15203.1 transporter [Caulobacter henricii]